MSKEKTEDQTIRIPSSGLIYTPGMVEYARRGLESRDFACLDVLAGMAWDAPAWALVGLVRGFYRVDGDYVVVTRSKVEAGLIESGERTTFVGLYREEK